MWMQLGMMAYNAYNANRAKKEARKQQEVIDAKAREQEAEANRLKADYEKNVKPVAEDMVRQGLSQGRSKAYGARESELSHGIGIARKRIASDKNAPMGAAGARGLGLDIAQAQQKANLVSQDEQHKQQLAHQGMGILAQKPAYMDPLARSQMNSQGIAQNNQAVQRMNGAQSINALGSAAGMLGKWYQGQDKAVKDGGQGDSGYRAIQGIKNSAGGYFGQLADKLRGMYSGGGGISAPEEGEGLSTGLEAPTEDATPSVNDSPSY